MLFAASRSASLVWSYTHVSWPLFAASVTEKGQKALAARGRRKREAVPRVIAQITRAPSFPYEPCFVFEREETGVLLRLKIRQFQVLQQFFRVQKWLMYAIS
jgi:hypothetical protein